EPRRAHLRAGVRRPRRTRAARVGSGCPNAVLQAARGRRLPTRGRHRRSGARGTRASRRERNVMVEIVMPRLSDTMEEGTILRWLKHDGEHVRRGEELVEIETDKATMNYLSDQEGVLKTVAREGDTLPVGELIAWVGDPSSSAPDAGEPGGGQTAPDGATVAGGVPSGEGAAPGAPGAEELAAATHERGADGRTGAAAPAGAAEGGAAPERPRASPLARRMARERGVDLGTLRGSGPGGRIVKADVLSAPAAQAAAGDERLAAAGAGVLAPSAAAPAAEGQPPTS